MTVRCEWQGILETTVDPTTVESVAGPEPVERGDVAELLSARPFEENRQESDSDGEVADVLQFASQGHVLGFGDSSIIVASTSHMLQIELVDANLVGPATEGHAVDKTVSDATEPFTGVDLRRPVGRRDGRLRGRSKTPSSKARTTWTHLRANTPSTRSACTTTAT